METLFGIIETLGELASRGEPASFYRSVVMAMDIMALMALGGIEVLSRKSRPFATFHLFSLPMVAFVAYAFLLFRAGPEGPGKEGALLHVVFLVWVFLICFWEWFSKPKGLEGKR